MNSEQEEHILEKMINTGALQEGHFALSSGLHSGSYLQCALFLMYPDNASLAGSLLGERLAPLKPSFVISPAMGGSDHWSRGCQIPWGSLYFLRTGKGGDEAEKIP